MQARGQAAVVDITDLTDDTPDTNADDDDVMITMVKVVKRRAPLLAQSASKRRALLAPPQPPPPPPPPPSPKGFKCAVCMEYMKDNMASTPCGCVKRPCLIRQRYIPILHARLIMPQAHACVPLQGCACCAAFSIQPEARVATFHPRACVQLCLAATMLNE